MNSTRNSSVQFTHGSVEVAMDVDQPSEEVLSDAAFDAINNAVIKALMSILIPNLNQFIEIMDIKPGPGITSEISAPFPSGECTVTVTVTVELEAKIDQDTVDALVVSRFMPVIASSIFTVVGQSQLDSAMEKSGYATRMAERMNMHMQAQLQGQMSPNAGMAPAVQSADDDYSTGQYL